LAEKKPSYLKEMLTSQGNLYAALGSLAAGALLSIPFGFGIGAIPLVAFAAGEAIAALYLPGSITFREKTDRKFRTRVRETTRTRLIQEIKARIRKQSVFDQQLKAWLRMRERVESLYRHAGDTRTNVTAQEVERLDDTTVEYLYLWLARLVIDERAAAVDMKDIQQRIITIDREVAAARPGVDLRQLQKARAEYVSLVERHNRMLSRRTAIEAAMLSMPDQLEELYQGIITNPTAGGFALKLDDMIDKLQLQEEIEAELSGEIEAVLPGVTFSMQRPHTTAPAAARGIAATP